MHNGREGDSSSMSYHSHTSSSSAARDHSSADGYVPQEQHQHQQQQQQHQANEWRNDAGIASGMRSNGSFADSPQAETSGGTPYTNKYDTSTAEFKNNPYQRSRSRTVRYDAWKAAQQQQEQQQQPSTPPPFYTRRGASRSMFDADIDFQAS
jgi:hypothetical protein